MKIQNIVLASLLALLSIESLPMEIVPKSIRDLRPEEKQIVNGVLDLSNKELTSLEGFDSIFRFMLRGKARLQKLRLIRNHLTTLPAGIFNGFTNLRELHLEDNQLSALPVGIFNGLTKLEGLWLYNNPLGILPVGIFNGLTSLQRLYLENNQLSALPVVIFNDLTSLQFLDLSSNQLNTLPLEIFSTVSSLQRLDLNNNPLSTLPDGIFNSLVNLQALMLHGNRLSQEQVNLIRAHFRGRNMETLDLSPRTINPTLLTRADLASITLKPNLTPQERAASVAEEERVASLTEKEKTAPLTKKEKVELEQLQAEHECPICYGEAGGPMTAETTYKTKCKPIGHKFHAEPCLQTWIRNGHTSCPVCRQDLSAEIAQQMPVAQNVTKPHENQHLAQKSTHKKKQNAKVAKRAKQEKVAIA